jgi:GntR family transcriptional regulator
MSARSLDRGSPMPLWAQLESDLRHRLDAGEFADRFPTDAEMVSQYDVSRHTVREAIRHLNRSGVLRRERGRGTVVNQARFEQSLGSLYSLFRSIESTGVEQTSEVLTMDQRTDSVASAQLGLPDGELFFFLERIRFTDGEPLAVDRAWVPLSIAGSLMEADFSRTALYDELEQRTGVRPDQGWERVSPIIPSAADRERLGLGRTDAAFHLERLGRAGDRPIEWRTTVIRGDRYRFVSDWSTRNGSDLSLTAASRSDWSAD